MQIKIFNLNFYYRSILLLLVLLISAAHLKAQSFDIVNNRKRVTMPFKMVRNMIIVQLHINNRGPFNFVLDTGVGIMVITDPKLLDSLNLSSKRVLKLLGLNGADYEAYVTPNLQVDMPDITSYGVAAAILKEDHFGLSNYAGMHIHGLLGYDFFNSLAVKLSFFDSTMTVSKPQNVRLLRRGVKIPISVEDRKPYMETWVKMPDGRETRRKLVIDIGAGHPLSLEHVLQENGLPQNFIAANLGVGLTGPVSGFISRVDQVELGKYTMKNVITSLPDNDFLKNQTFTVPRDGNIGLGILKRFTIIFDYTNNAMYLKKGKLFNEPFEHDMSGMEYYFDGEDFSHLIIGRVEPGSAADNIGLMPGDEIVSINLKQISHMDIEQIDDIFRSRNGRSLLLEVFRDKEYKRTILTLKRRI